jgi:hypothetical protein
VDRDKNWLGAEVVSCAGCGARLVALIHSPFCDDYRLYCGELSKFRYYDPLCIVTVDGLPADCTLKQTMAAIEPLLRPFDCGGRFHGDAPRRCFACSTVVPAATRKDPSPYSGCEDGDRDPTPEEQAATIASRPNSSGESGCGQRVEVAVPNQPLHQMCCLLVGFG